MTAMLGSNTALSTIHVIPVNDAPVATSNSYVGDEDGGIFGNIMSDDTGAGVDGDADGDPIVVTQFEVNGTSYAVDSYEPIPGVGAFYITPNGSFGFYPDPDFNGAVPTVTYTITDGNGGTATATLDITITPMPDAPVPAELNVFIDEDTSTSIERLYAADADGDTLTYAAGTTTPAHGTLSINADGSFTYHAGCRLQRHRHLLLHGRRRRHDGRAARHCHCAADRRRATRHR